MLLGNFYSLGGKGNRFWRKLSRAHGKFTGAVQHWNMFAPQVGKSVFIPVIFLRYEDGRESLIRSVIEPPLNHFGPRDATSLNRNLPMEKRSYGWRVHIGKGRVRKSEVNAVRDKVASVQQDDYMRWRLIQHMRAHPEDEGQIRSVMLYRLVANHRHDGKPAYWRKMTHMRSYPFGQKHRKILWPQDGTPMPSKQMIKRYQLQKKQPKSS